MARGFTNTSLHKIWQMLLFVGVVLLCAASPFAQNKYEQRPITKIDISISGADDDTKAIEEYRGIARDAVGDVYSTPRIRDAIEALYKTKKVDTVSVSAALENGAGVALNFNIRRKTQAQRVSVVVGKSAGEKVTEEDLLFKLNLVTPGSVITEQTLRSNADQILDYLRERGYYRSEVVYEQRPLQYQTDVGVTFRVALNEPARVDEVSVKIGGYEKPIPPKALKLRKDGLYTRERVITDTAKIRELLRKEKFGAPELDEPRITYDSDANAISVSFTGKAGPTVEVVTETEGKEKKESRKNLLPVLREGTLDYAAIVEGERRLENNYQEQGYFFADVTPLCSATPQLVDTENNPIANDTQFLCSFLGGEDLTGKQVQVKYKVDLNRKLRLAKIRVRGTDKLTIEDISTILNSQVANPLAIIPVLGYGRGYTSERILEEDKSTIESLMHELGYQYAQVRVNRGVSPSGDDLIITFEIEEGPPTIVSEVDITGNKAIATDTLRAELPSLIGGNYSRARVRNATQRLAKYYSDAGYYEARVTSSIIEPVDPKPDEPRNLKIEFKVESEGRKVVIRRVLVTGNDNTDRDSVLKTIALREGELLRAADIYLSEQNLYATDAFSRVEIKSQPVGDAPDGSRLTDVIVSVDEQPPRLASYGGGYSTDLGLSGFFDIRHVNLFGNLWQGGARVKFSQRQQLVQFDFINPRFIPDGVKRFAPLTLSAQYQRDSTVTRFFRSAFDQGTFGIVQRVDANGNPIDQFGAPSGSPTINRLALTAETSRTISRKNRSILFIRARFEDVRLVNIDSLLIKDLLLPDSRTRISGFGVTFVRDTRQNCSVKYSLLDLIAKGEQSDPCRYNASDPTRGDYLTADYNVSLPFLGANIGFQKFQASYNYYYTFPAVKGRSTTLAARAIVGAGSVFSNGNRFTNAAFPSLNGLLPISERFFAGGSNNLRGFNFEEAGPRVVIVPTGTFRNSRGNAVFLDPFTIPFGGNAIAITNIEARVPISKSIRAVPFYDGGNVFRRAKEIFNPANPAATDIDGLNQRARWTHTVGLGFRIKTPVGGEFGFDYGRLLNPPIFIIRQTVGPNALYKLPQDHIHFRFSQAF
ncbi:MAG: POTRA domain-containing protein [Pyrinomonadaceae bacterium]